jgi:hypothetical protein
LFLEDFDVDAGMQRDRCGDVSEVV